MSDLVEKPNPAVTGKAADTKTPGDKIEPHVSQQQVGTPKPEAAQGDSTAAPVDGKPSGTAIETHVSQQQLGQPDALKIVKEAQKPVGTAAGLADVELVGANTPPKPPEEKRLSAKELEKIAEAIDTAANGGLTGIGTDKDAINEQLKRLKNPKDREALDKIYRDKVGHGIEDELRDELSGSDLDRALALWKPTNIDAARVSIALTEHKEWGMGARSNSTVERDLRDTVSTMNSQQIAEMDKAYRAEHGGVSVHDALLKDPNLPEATKQALEIYLKGTDKRTDADTLKLAEIALKQKNLDMFQEAFRDASPTARKAFLDDNGEKRVLTTFGQRVGGGRANPHQAYYRQTDDSKQALDYAKLGKLDTSTKIEANTGSVNDNEEAIELTLENMTDEQRRSYMDGKKLANTPTEGLTDAQKADKAYYEKTFKALSAAGNEREVKKWEDMIATKGGTLVTKLSKHGGAWDDSIGQVLRTIEDMTEDDWNKLKKDPDQLQRVRDVLKIDLSENEMKRVDAMLKAKLDADSFIKSQAAQRDVLESVSDEVGFFNTSEEGVLDSLRRMSKTDQEKYRTDPEFKRKVDKLVTDGMDVGEEQKSAFAVLDAITRGDKPEDDILSKLYVHADHINTDEAKVIEDLEEAFRKDPKLRERLAKDPEYRKKFDEAIRGALDDDEYQRYAKPLIEEGRIPLKIKAELYTGFFNDDEKSLLDVISKGSEKDWDELLTDPKSTLPFLSAEEREVALNLARQRGEMRPEDKIRAAMLGGGTAEEAIHETLKGLPQEKIETIRAEYLRKYDSDLLGDTMGEMGGADREKAVNSLGAQPATAREAFNTRRDGVYRTVDGIGRSFVDTVDGTADMTMDELNQYAAGMSSYSRRFEEMPPEQRKQFQENLLKAKELYAKSENSAADMLVDGGIIAAGVIGAKFTGGVSLSLLAYTSLGGALFKVGAKSAILGNDYDFASADALIDGATGAIDAATIFLGPAQAAQFLKLGAKSAETAAATVIAQSDDLLKVTGKQILKEGTEDKLQRRLFQEVAFAISNGAEGVDQKAIARVAQEFAASPEDVPRLAALVEDSLGKAIATEGSNALKAQMRELGLNSAAGYVGGGMSGTVYSLKDLDESKSVGDNLAMIGQSGFTGAMFGTGMAAGFTAGLRGVARGISHLRNVDGPSPHLAPHDAPAPHDTPVPRDTSVPNDTPPATTADRLVATAGGAVVATEGGSQVAGQVAEAVDDLAINGSESTVQNAAGQTLRDGTTSGGGENGFRVPGSDGSQKSFKQGDSVKFEGDRGILAGYDPHTGEAIVEFPERTEWARRISTFDNSDGHYKPIEIRGEKYYRNDEGQVFGILDFDGQERIYIEHKFKLAQRSQLTEGPPLPLKQKQLFERDGSIPDGVANGDNPLPPPLPPRAQPKPVEARIEPPKVPKVDFHLEGTHYHASDLYDGAVLTLDGKALGRELNPDGPPITIGRTSLGLDLEGVNGKVSRDHASLQFDKEQQMYYMEEHSTNGTYLKRAGEDHFTYLEPGKDKPYRVYLGPNDVVRLGHPEGPEIKLRVRDGQNMKPPPGPKGDVDVRVFFDGKPLPLSPDGELIIGRSHQSFGNDSPSDILNRRVASTHATLKFNETAQQWELTDLTSAGRHPSADQANQTVMMRVGGNGTYIKRADGTLDFVQGRSTLIGPNDQVHLGSPDGPELKFITNQGQRQPDGRVIIPRKNYDQAVKRPDGTTEISNFLSYKRIEDPYGRVLQTLTPEGHRTGFTYGPDGRVNTIRFDDESVALLADDGKWMRVKADGQREPFWDGAIDIEPDGAIKFTDRGKPPMSTIERVDGVREVIHPNGRVEFTNVDFHDELGAMNRISNSFENPAQGARFKEMMNRFEKRAREAGLSREEQAKTFLQVRRLFTAEYGAFLTAPERSRLAEQVLDLASDPRICQGYNNTCNVSTVEARMFHRKPSEAARLISDVVINGKYVTADGVTVDLARIPGVLAPDGESTALAKTFQANGTDIRIDGKRSYASQIFEVTAVNLKWARGSHSEFNLKPGEIVVYEKPTGPARSKTGEELVKYSVNHQGFLVREVVKDQPSIKTYELTDVYNEIAGTKEKNFVIFGDPKLRGSTLEGSYAVNSPQELQQALENMKRDGGGPAILLVHTKHEPFYTDSGAGRAGGSGGWHVVNVHDVRRDPKTGQMVADVTNQWGFGKDHVGDRAIPLDVLFRSTLEPPAVAKPVPEPPPLPLRDEKKKKGWFRNLFSSEPAAAAPQGVGDGALARTADGADARAFTSAQILGDRDPKGGLWTPNRHFDELEYEDRHALFEMLNGRETPLTDPDFTDSFTKQAIPIIKDWEENHKPLFKQMKEARDVILETRDRYAELAEQVPDLHAGTYSRARELLTDYYQDQPDKLKIINAYLDARETNFRLLEKLDDALEPRRQQIEDLANSVVAGFRNADGSLVGIPNVKVELVSPEQMGSAVATYGDGVLRINKAELLNNKSVADLLGTVYHELVHNEQQTTILRSLADELKLGATASGADLAVLRQLYQDRTGGPISEAYARRVMELRNGVELPEQAAARAQELVNAFALNHPVGKEWIELGNSFRRIQREIPRLEGRADEKSVAARILMDLSSNKSGKLTSQRFFGTDTMPPELADYAKRLNRYMRGVDDDAWSNEVEMEARKVIMDHMRRHMDQINDRRRELYENYMQFHEYDAWLAGERIRRAAIANGATFRDPKNSLWDEIDWIQ